MSDAPDRHGEAEDAYREAAASLLNSLDLHLVAWIERVASSRLPDEWSPQQRAALEPAIREVAEATRGEIVATLRDLFSLDVDDQRAGPLAILRSGVGPANRLLAASGVPPIDRDPVTASMFPDDLYGLGPANFDDIDPSLHDAGLIWGAAKAHVMLIRHQH